MIRSFVETSFAYNPMTCETRLLGVNLDRKYREHGLQVEEIPLTPDYVELTDDGYIHVHDWKTGRQQNTHFEQLEFYAAALLHYQSSPKGAKLTLHFIDESGVYPQTKWMKPEDLYALQFKIQKIAERLNGDLTQIKPDPGSHCTESYCPLRNVCPATQAALSLVDDDHGATLPIVYSAEDIQNEGHAVYMLHRLRVLDEAMKAAWKALDEWTDQHVDGIPLPDGRHYKAIEETREKIEVNAEAMKILHEIFGESIDDALKIELPKGSLAKLIKSQLSGARAKALEQDIYKQLRDAGSMQEKTITVHKVVK